MKTITFDRRLFQYLATLSGSLVVITVGINSGWPSPYIPTLLASSEIPTSSTQASWCAVMPLLGSIPGAFLGSQIVDRIGRKTSILVITPVLLASFTAIAFAKSIHLISAARFIIGSSEGCLFTTLPIYLAEISDPEIRGLLSSTMSIAALLGILIINIIGPLATIFTSSFVSVAICLTHACTFAFMPESPYFYIKKSKESAARKSLQVLRGTTNIDQELAALYDAIKRQESKRNLKYSDLFTVKSNRKAVMIYVILTLANRFSGKNPLVYYTTIIFQTANAGLDPHLSVVIYNVVGICATILALFVIDRFGRRKLMLFSAAGCCVSLAAEGVYFFLQRQRSPEFLINLNWLPITALVCYNVIFCLGINFGPLLLLGELFPMNIKAKAVGLGDSFTAVMGVASSQFFHVTNDAFAMYVPFWTFAVCTAISFVFVYRFLIETKGKTLEQIQLELLEL